MLAERSSARFLAILQGIGAPLPFLWTDLSEQDILLLTKNDMTSPLAEKLLHKAANHDENTPHLQQAVELDLYRQTLQQAQVSCVAFQPRTPTRQCMGRAGCLAYVAGAALQ